MRMLTAIVVSLYFLLSGGSTSAQPTRPEIISQVTAEQVLAALQQAGYKIKLVNAPDGTKYLKAEMVGLNVLVVLLGCDPAHKDQCIGVRFYVGFAKDPALNLDLANTINNTQFGSKAYINQAGDFVFQLDMDIEGGSSVENIKHNANLFQSELKSLLTPSK